MTAIAEIGAAGLDLDEPETGRRVRLLAVDDEPAVLRSLRTLFRGSAYELHLVESGAQALELLEQYPIDVILSDMRMPRMPGPDFLAEARRRRPETMRIVLSGYADPQSVIDVLNETGIFAFVHKPWDSADLRMKVDAAAEQVRLKRLIEQKNRELAELNQSLERKVRERTAQLELAHDQLHDAMMELEESYSSLVQMLAHVTEERIPKSRGQGLRVARVARRLAEGLGLSRVEVRDIEAAALLQNIGLIVVPDEILELPPERLTLDQLAQLQRHPLLGEATLMAVPAMAQVAAIVRSHHELYDGTGYPDGLRGEAIPLGARIIAIANDFRELLDGEATGEALTEDEAHAWLSRNVGHRYEPSLVERLGRQELPPAGAGKVELAEIQVLDSDALLPGMVLYERLLSRDGLLLASAGQRITSGTIEAIRRLESDEGTGYRIYILDAADHGLQMDPRPPAPGG